MRIGIVVNSFPSLSESFIANKVKALCNRGHDVFVFCTKIDENTLAIYDLQRIKNLHIINIDIKTYLSNAIPNFFRNPNVFTGSIKGDVKLIKQAFIHNIRRYYLRKYVCDVYHFEFSGLGVNYLDNIPELHGKIVVSCRGSAEIVKLQNDEILK